MKLRFGFIAAFIVGILISGMAMSPAKSIKYTSSSYDDLVSLFNEFRAFESADHVGGIPDYSAKVMSAKRKELVNFKKRLEAINPNNWEVAKKVDFVLVWAEMNGMQFNLDVLKPWARDPLFYVPLQEEGAGAVIEIDIRVDEFPLSDERLAEFSKALKVLPKMYKTAEVNLTEPKGDLAKLALYYIEEEIEQYNQLAEDLAEHHPELVQAAKDAVVAVKAYGKWLEANIDKMPKYAGIGVENYNWYFKNVHLFPYTHAQSEAIVDHEYSRIITFLKLEENRFRDVQPLEVADTAEEYYGRLDYALNYMLMWLERENIMTVPEWADAADYSDPSEDRQLRPGPMVIDSRVRVREVLPGETHEFIGHLLDWQRHMRDERPIRGANRLFRMDWIRTEGFAAGSEELFMVAGDLDERNPHGREMQYLMNASHCSLSIPDLKLHANEIDLEEARALCAKIMPYNWSDKDDTMVWFEQQSNLRYPGFHTGVVMGKSQLTKLFRERAMQLGKDFKIRDFFDEYVAAGIIPMSLTRWEMLGDDSEIKAICPLIK